MSNFVFILRNLVGSGMTNTESALVVLEAFFQSEGNELRNNAISCRSEIADLKKGLTENTKSEEQTEIAFTKIKLRVLFLIDEVEKTTFDDEWAINYFAMLDPNPAYDPFFSPLKKPEKMSEEIPKETIIEMPLDSTKSKTNWSKRLLPIGGVLLGGFLLSGVLGYSPFSKQDNNNGYVSSSQALNTNNTDPKQNTVATSQQNTTGLTGGKIQANNRAKQVEEQKEEQEVTPKHKPIQPIKGEISNSETEYKVSPPTPAQKTRPVPSVKPNPTPVVKLNTEPIKPKPVINPKSTPAVEPTETIQPAVVKPNAISGIISSPKSKTTSKTPDVKINKTSLDNPNAPIVKPKSVPERYQTINYQDSLNIVMSNISKIEADTLQLYNQILKLNQIQKKDAKTIKNLKNEENKLKNLERELAILRSKQAKFWNIIHRYK